MKEFTAKEMEGCPSFDTCIDIEFVKVDEDGEIMLIESVHDESNMYRKVYPSPFYCNPLDRMRAICKMLFKQYSEPIGSLVKIKITDGHYVELEFRYWSSLEIFFIPLSINPFLHTDLTEITGEEMGL